MAKRYFCNPINVDYRYQFNQDPRVGKLQINREAADPSMILFKGKYYIFASMNLSVWVSEDMANWESYRLPENLPLYDYAPDVRVIGDYVYFCASKRGEICNRFRTKDIINGPYEEIPGTFDYWDPNLFIDDDGRIYFFWGCTNTDPIWGCELDPETMNPKTEKVAILAGDPFNRGFERCGEDHCTEPASEEEIEAKFNGFLKAQGIEDPNKLPPQLQAVAPMIKGMFSNMPYIEGPWLTKHEGKYYMQYAFPGTQYNGYGDGVFVSDKPLGPYTIPENILYSYKPGGYLPGAGHGSTMEDMDGNWWHTASMRISMNHQFERRVGIWPVGFDADGEMFCNQSYGDWPFAVEDGKMDPWKDPEWMPLHIGKTVTASSWEKGKEPAKAVEENVQTWWRAADNKPGQWLQVDLGEVKDVRAIQVNFADDSLDIPVPGELTPGLQPRFIDKETIPTQWKLEGSADGVTYFVIEDKMDAATDLPHDLVVREEGLQVRFVKLTVNALPYAQQAAVSGLRIFGIGQGPKPEIPAYTLTKLGDRDMQVEITDPAADTAAAAKGFNIYFGNQPDKLYNSYLITEKNSQKIGALIVGREYYVRVDAFNENGITVGSVQKLI